jgi:hypothetical protein
VQPAHDGAHRHVENPGRFGVSEPVDVDELDDLPERLVERIEGPHDLDVELVIDDGVGAIPGNGQPIGGRVGVAEQFRAATAVDVRVAQDRQQPRPRVATVKPPMPR